VVGAARGMDAQSVSRPRSILSIGGEERVRDLQSKSRPKSTLLSVAGAAGEMDASPGRGRFCP
jgi:hypothetical protein